MKKYYRWGIIGIGIVIVFFLVWPKSGNNKLSEIAMTKTPWKDLFLPETLKNPGKVEWNIEGETSKSIAKIEASQPQKEIDRVAKILRIKGIKITDINKEDKDMVFYAKYGNGGYWNRGSSFVQVKENITSSNQLKTNTNLEIGEIKSKLEKILGEVDNKEIRWVDVGYKKMVYPRMVTSDEQNGNIITFLGDWVVDGKIVRSFTDNSIKISTTRDGRIIGVDIYLLPEVVVNGEENVISKDILVKTNNEDMGIVNYVGGKNYELEVDNINIENVNVTQQELVYVYDGRRNKLIPYFLLTGTSVAMGPVKVEMITGAIRE